MVVVSEGVTGGGPYTLGVSKIVHWLSPPMSKANPDRIQSHIFLEAFFILQRSPIRGDFDILTKGFFQVQCLFFGDWVAIDVVFVINVVFLEVVKLQVVQG